MLVYPRQAIPKGVIFLLDGGSEDYTRKREDAYIPVERWPQRAAAHPPTGWWFIDDTHLEAYTQRYATADLAGFEQLMITPPTGRRPQGRDLGDEEFPMRPVIEKLTEILTSWYQKNKSRPKLVAYVLQPQHWGGGTP
jgi:hypothetical protein